MNETILLILSLSISGSILAGILFIVKPLVKDILPKSVQYYIWIIVLLRLVVPVSFEGSIMDEVFRSAGVNTSEQAVTVPAENKVSDAFTIQPGQETNNRGQTINPADGPKQRDIDMGELIFDNLLLIWLLGAVITLSVNVVGYTRFIKHIKKSNEPVFPGEYEMLSGILKSSRAKLVRNIHVTTPMLIGIISPCIVIPDSALTNIQLRNILLHEAAHLKRFDIALKWFTVIVTSLHWFNPVMYFIKKEIGRACELSCDEAVIKSLDAKGRQSYGDTLIALASANKYPIGVLSTTMCEEKRTLKERLTAIMKHSRKSKLVIGVSAVLIAAAACGAAALGAVVGAGDKEPPQIYVSEDMSVYNLTEIAKYKTPYVGDHSKALALAGLLPAPDKFFKQQYISIRTSSKPYILNVFYEARSNDKYAGEWPIEDTDSAVYKNLHNNALVLFCMVDNLDQVVFYLRNSQSSGSLDETMYDTSFTFSRDFLEEKFGDLSLLGQDLAKLQNALAE